MTASFRCIDGEFFIRQTKLKLGYGEGVAFSYGQNGHESYGVSGVCRVYKKGVARLPI